MIYTTLISTFDLLDHLTDPDWAIVDCRFMLSDPNWGEREYLKSHIPGAVYAHLERDLSGPVIRGVTGRHPLPSVEAAAAVFSRLGISEGVQVVAYDASGGAHAARLWWMLRWLSHDRAAVLDGGWDKWVREGLPVKAGAEQRSPRAFIPHERPELACSTREVDTVRKDPASLLIDSRSADRFRGENETIDPIPGHIPGALSAPYADNLNPEGTFRSSTELKARFEKMLGKIPAERAVFYCGSGVTAAHNILALEHAGLGEARLYPGSYSEWIADPSRPVEK